MKTSFKQNDPWNLYGRKINNTPTPNLNGSTIITNPSWFCVKVHEGKSSYTYTADVKTDCHGNVSGGGTRVGTYKNCNFTVVAHNLSDDPIVISYAWKFTNRLGPDIIADEHNVPLSATELREFEENRKELKIGADETVYLFKDILIDERYGHKIRLNIYEMKIFKNNELIAQVQIQPIFHADCFVASAIYRDSRHPSVNELKMFRDHILTRFYYGNKFINWYYRSGPRLALIVNKHPWLRISGRFFIGLLVYCLMRMRKLFSSPSGNI